MPVVAIAAVVGIVWLLSQAQANATNATQTPALPPAQPAGGKVATAGAIIGATTGIVKLAGQATAGGVPGISPSTGVTRTGASTAAVRIGGAALAAGGVLTWFQSKSNVGRTIGGTEAGVGTAIAVGAALGPATLGISAGIGALVGFLAGLNKNDTKLARWDFVAKLGYTKDGNGFDKLVRSDMAKLPNVGPTLAEALWSEAVGRIGRKSNAWNSDYLNRLIAALNGSTVHAYRDDPTKGAQPVA